MTTRAACILFSGLHKMPLQNSAMTRSAAARAVSILSLALAFIAGTVFARSEPNIDREHFAPLRSPPFCKGKLAHTRSPSPIWRNDSLVGREGTLEFSADMKNVLFTETIQTNSADSPLGKGTRGPIPLIIMLEATNITVTPEAPLNLNISMHLVSAAE